MALSTIGTNAITDGTIATGDIADDAVTAAKATGFGKIGQVVTTNLTVPASTTVKASDGNFTDSSLLASLTPTATTSKILVMCTVNAGSSSNSNGLHVGRFTQAVSGGSTTNVFIGDAEGNRIRTSSGKQNEAGGPDTLLVHTFNFVLTPSTTSAVTVTYQFATRGTGSGTAYINRTHTNTDTSEFQRTASEITLMEVLA